MIDSGSELTRRGFLGTVGGLLVLAACSSKSGDAARQSTTSTRAKGASGPKGWAGTTLSTTPDANGMLLPEGFTSRVVATSGQPVAGTDYLWPPAPDGAATFADPKVKGGWYHAVNAETGATLGGGVSALRFNPGGEVVDAYRLVGGTNINCAGGATPWDTWLTCEEVERGQVFECDPTTPDSGQPVPALGHFKHEAVGVDEQGRRLYLTEDQPDGLFYRFTPTKWPDLTAGVLEAAVVDADGAVSWREVPDATATQAPIRTQGFGATPFAGGEGIAVGDTPDGRRVWFSTKLDDVVRELDPTAGTMQEIYRASPESALHGVDNLWWDEPAQHLYVAEDGDDNQLMALDLTGRITPLLQLTGHEGSELTGPTMDPKRSTLLFSSQRGLAGTNLGITYAVTGPFPTA